MPFVAARACWPRTGRWSSTPASTPAAAPRTSSSSAMRTPRTRVVGQDQPADDGRAFDRLKDDFLAALATRNSSSSPTSTAARSPSIACSVRVINELAWHNLFIRTLLVRPEADELAGFEPEYTIIDLPSFRADPERHGSRSETVIAVNFTEKLILIGGTAYAGEMKKCGVRPAQLPAAAAGHHADALLGQHRPRRRHARSSSACPAPARRPCRPTPTAR